MSKNLSVGVEVKTEKPVEIVELFRLAAGTYSSGESNGVLMLTAQPIIGQGREKLPYAVKYVNDIEVQIGTVIPVAVNGDVVRLKGWLANDYSVEATRAREAGESGEMIDLTALQDGAYVEILYDTRIGFGQIVLVKDIDVFCSGELRDYLEDSRPVMLLDETRFDPKQLDGLHEDAPDEEGDSGKAGDAAEAGKAGDGEASSGEDEDDEYQLRPSKDGK